MANVYKITDWDQLYENHRSRELKHLSYVPIPNKHHGDGYTELIDHPNGAAHLGAWVALLQLHSRVSGVKSRRSGVLSRGGGGAHDAASLGRMTNLGTEIYAEVIPRLVAIGWLTEDASQPKETQPTPRNAGGTREVRGKTPEDCRQNRTEQNRTEVRTCTDSFEKFWDAYPKKKAKKDALKAWIKLNPDAELTERILLAVRARASTEEWTKDKGQFVPLPATYIRGERWEDELGVGASANGATHPQGEPDTPDHLWDGLETPDGFAPEFSEDEFFNHLRAAVDEETFYAWFEPIEGAWVDAENRTAVLAVPSRFFANWIQANFLDDLTEAADAATDCKIETIKYVLAKSLEDLPV